MVQKDYKILLAEELAKAGNKKAMLTVFDYYKESDLLIENIELVLRYLTELAKNGDAYAMRHLGNLYEYGRGIKLNHKIAIEWYEKSADASDSYAMCSLGYAYYYGKGGEIDYGKAYKYLSQAVLLENTNAMYKLGDMYYYGHHVSESKEIAFFWYDKADDNYYDCYPYEQASIDYRMGKCYLYGHGIEQDLSQAIEKLTDAESSLADQIKDNDDPYGFAKLILPDVAAELKKARLINSKILKYIKEIVMCG
jgi:TPR repeat protein